MCALQSAAVIPGILSEADTDVLIVVYQVVFSDFARSFAKPRIRLVVEVLIARDDDIFGFILVPFGFDALQRAVCIEEAFWYGKVHRIELVLVMRTLA